MKVYKENTEKHTHIYPHTLTQHVMVLYEAFGPSKPGQNKCRESSKSLCYTNKC